MLNNYLEVLEQNESDNPPTKQIQKSVKAKKLKNIIKLSQIWRICDLITFLKLKFAEWL